jgi:hypothetical protein
LREKRKSFNVTNLAAGGGFHRGRTLSEGVYPQVSGSYAGILENKRRGSRSGRGSGSGSGSGGGNAKSHAPTPVVIDGFSTYGAASASARSALDDSEGEEEKNRYVGVRGNETEVEQRRVSLRSGAVERRSLTPIPPDFERK